MPLSSLTKRSVKDIAMDPSLASLGSEHGSEVIVVLSLVSSCKS